MIDIGFVLACSYRETAVKELEYMIDENDWLKVFKNKKDAEVFISNNNLIESDISVLYHTYCCNCGKEYFLSKEEQANGKLDEFGYYYNSEVCTCSIQ